MKSFLSAVMEWKSGVCFLYTGTMVLYMAALLMFDAAPDLRTMFSLLLISALACFIQYLAFTEHIIKRMRYAFRLLLFVVLFLPVLTGCAVLGRWFPTGRAGSWLLFLAIFLGIFAVFTGGFEVYFHLTGRKYDGILGQYKKQREQQP